MKWKYFTSRQVKEAKDWAEKGNFAVHQNIFKFRGKTTAHLIASESNLLIAVRILGLRKGYIQRTSTLHLDLFGAPLEKAIKLCERDTHTLCMDAT